MERETSKRRAQLAQSVRAISSIQSAIAKGEPNRRTNERWKNAAVRAGELLDAGGYLRLPEVLALIPVSASTWWEGCRSGRFPKGVKIGPRCTAWRAAVIRQLLQDLESGSIDGDKA
ncbi:hypothetical protein C7S18_05730 [Ahniella affigens]|uniref:Uncharacterized protein n=2 Tax=Ahniella affigens TaxID=2021234 RepID=A0A2P1PPF6_9GAMM|nr:AlpA family phage regulatory protein [Ahniella affigens]AVP96730.1 hypothetical protein C7S18_05730 [Ahniella affigens]